MVRREADQTRSRKTTAPDRERRTPPRVRVDGSRGNARAFWREWRARGRPCVGDGRGTRSRPARARRVARLTFGATECDEASPISRFSFVGFAARWRDAEIKISRPNCQRDPKDTTQHLSLLNGCSPRHSSRARLCHRRVKPDRFRPPHRNTSARASYRRASSPAPLRAGRRSRESHRPPGRWLTESRVRRTREDGPRWRSDRVRRRRVRGASPISRAPRCAPLSWRFRDRRPPTEAPAAATIDADARARVAAAVTSRLARACFFSRVDRMPFASLSLTDDDPVHAKRFETPRLRTTVS